MQKEVPVGEVAVTGGQDDLIALGIGSCVVVTLYDQKHKIGALAHAMLPVASSLLRTMNSELKDTRYIDAAIDRMLEKMQELGAKKQDIEAKIIGGANMFAVSNLGESIGGRNIAAAGERLKSHGIPVVGECVSGSQGRSVEFSAASGIVTVKTKF